MVAGGGGAKVKCGLYMAAKKRPKFQVDSNALALRWTVLTQAAPLPDFRGSCEEHGPGND